MANVKFAYGTTVPKTSTTGFDDGCIYFNTSTRNIYLRQGSSVYTFDGNNTIYTSDSFSQLKNIEETFVEGNMPINCTNGTYKGNSNKPINGIVTGYSFSQNVTSVDATFDISLGYTDLKIYYESNSKPLGWTSMSNSAPFSLTVYYIPAR